MPATERARKFLCAVCHNKAEARPGMKLPNKEFACEACTAQIKKVLGSDYLVKLSGILGSQLPRFIVQTAQRQAKGYAGGKGKIRKMQVTKTESGITVKREATEAVQSNLISKDTANYRDAELNDKQGGFTCVTCDLFAYRDKKGACRVAEGDIEPVGICDLWRPSEHFIATATRMVKSQPDSSDVHVDGFFEEIVKSEDCIIADAPDGIGE